MQEQQTHLVSSVDMLEHSRETILAPSHADEVLQLGQSFGRTAKGQGDACQVKVGLR